MSSIRPRIKPFHPANKLGGKALTRQSSEFKLPCKILSVDSIKIRNSELVTHQDRFVFNGWTLSNLIYLLGVKLSYSQVPWHYFIPLTNYLM